MRGLPARLARALRALVPGLGVETRAQLDGLRRDMRGIHDALARIERHDQQVRALLEHDLALQGREDEIDGLFGAPGLREHTATVIRRATVVDEPCPHVVVDDLLPRPLYAALVRGLPPAALFEGKERDRRFLHLPFRLSSRYGRRVWDTFVKEVVAGMVLPAVVETFRRPLEQLVSAHFPAFGSDPLARLSMRSSSGRVFLHTSGYEIPPHRDPAWSFITCLFYVARPGDDERWGTQLYAVDDDAASPNASPDWIDRSRCRLVRDVEYRANRLVAFLNSRGAHGAAIPAGDDAPPVERALYQFRIMPDKASVVSLVGSLPAAERAAWSDKVPAY